MILSRWKLMAGVLGISLGGLAAMAGQCSKNDNAKGSPPPEIPVVPTASAPADPPPMPMAKMPPPAPVTPPVAEPAKVPSALPELPVIPAGGTAPSSLPVTPPLSSPATPPPIPSSVIPDTKTPLPPPMAEPAVPTAPPMRVPSDPLIGHSPVPPKTGFTPDLMIPDAGTTSMELKQTKVAATKYRILLCVGEGDPCFEVRCGDDLMLKVVCEKVDVKSPDKGQGLSAVKASGKVRFAGFGAEGTCDELHFMAGTGEVGMTGNVRICVKDKLGRVESELAADVMRYKIDPHAISGNGILKP